MTVVEEWAKNIVDTHFENFEKEVVERAKNRIIDIVGSTIGGAVGAGNQELVDLVKEWGGKKEATILGYGVKAPAHNVAMVNSIMARSFDFGELWPGDFSKPRAPTEPRIPPVHLSESAVPTAVTMAEREHVSGKELITALILGENIDYRLCASSNALPMGWDAIGVFNKFGDTAIAGKLLGLDEQQLVNAFGIVVNQLGGSMQCTWEGSNSFKILHGFSSRDGIIAAELAGKGWTGMKDALFSKYGYFTLYTSCRDREILTRGLGKEYYSDTYIKPYPCCAVTHPPVTCTLELIREYDINTKNVDEVIVNGGPRSRDSQCGQLYPIEAGVFPQGYAIFNTQYSVASILVRKGLRLEYFTDEYIRDPEVVEFAQKVKLTGGLPPEKMWASEITVKMKDGKEFHKAVDGVKGLVGEEIFKKYRDNVAFAKTVSEKNAEAALSMLKKLEEIDDVSKIVKLLKIAI